MENLNRDLLVLFRHELLQPGAMDRYVKSIHKALYHAESLENFISAHEIININKYKIITVPYKISNYIRSRKQTPFVFLFNKN